MKTSNDLTQEDFDRLLSWLADDEGQAGESYERIRAGLISFFGFRGCADPEILADETINRVASRLGSLKVDKAKRKINIFYGFASKICLEQMSLSRKREIQLDSDLQIKDPKTCLFEGGEDALFLCLERCLATLPKDDNFLVISYYSDEKSSRFAKRRSIAKKMKLRIGALHTRVYRIRNALKACIDECLTELDV